MTTSENALVGLFPLNLQSVGAPGAPVVKLSLLVYTPRQEVTGHAEVTQAINPPLDLKSHVHGNLIHETVMGPGSKILIKLLGWPEIVWPPKGGVGPVIPENFSAQVLLEPDYNSGTITFEYRTELSGKWNRVVEKIKRVD